MYSKPRLVISTVGTSLLTNQVYKYLDSDIEYWLTRLEDTANYTQDEINSHKDIGETIEDLEEMAKNILKSNDIKKIRKVSAELNGIYELYDKSFDKAKLDHHYLIATDTAQGQITANLVKDYLTNKVEFVDTYTPEKFSTRSNKNFHQGIDDLIHWVDKKIKNDYQGYDIYFNLVGGFKALQGCMNTIGMFYADKIVYIFEGKYSKLIIIPRLPITIDFDEVKEHIITLTLLDNGASLSPSKTENVPETLIAEIDGEITLSNWGQLIWNQCEYKFLSQDLLEGFPRIKYDDSFRREYKKISDNNDKVLLHKTIAKVSRLLEESNGDTRTVGKQVEYYPYQGAKDKDGVDHFYVGKQFRVSCKKQSEVLVLRHYGTHKYVEGKETT